MLADVRFVRNIFLSSGIHQLIDCGTSRDKTGPSCEQHLENFMLNHAMKVHGKSSPDFVEKGWISDDYHSVTGLGSGI